MPHDIDWETACNDFHPAFALVRGEGLMASGLRSMSSHEPDAKPVPSKRDRPDRRPARLRTAVLLIPELLP